MPTTMSAAHQYMEDTAVSRSDREQLIERYLRGELSAAEEERFFIEVAGSNELRHELKAYRVVDETLSRDSIRLAEPQTALRSRLEQQMAGASAPSAASSTQALQKGWSPLSARAWYLIAAVSASLLMIGLMATLVDRPAPEPVPSPQQTRTQHPPLVPPSSMTASGATSRMESKPEPAVSQTNIVPRNEPSVSPQAVPTPDGITQRRDRAETTISGNQQSTTNLTKAPATRSSIETSRRDTTSGEAMIPVRIGKPKKMNESNP